MSEPTTTDDANDEATIKTAEEFGREQEAKAARRAHELRLQVERERTSRVMAIVWGPVVLLLLLGGAALIAFIVHSVTAEHTREAELDKLHKISVWCYADPNADGATSYVEGAPDDVRDYCPDAHQSYG